MPTDEQLYSRFIHGESDALDELLIRHKDGLTWFLYGIVKNVEDAEDLMMDTFALLITKKVNFKNNSSFKTWLYGIGRNLAKKHVRKSHYANEQIMNTLPEKYMEQLEDSDLLVDVIKAEDSGRLYAALNAIPEEYATAIYLQYIERLSSEQTAKIMKKSLKQIYNLTSRAKVRLRQELE